MNYIGVDKITRLSILYDTEYSIIKEEILKMARENFMSIDEIILRYRSLRDLAEASKEEE